MRIYARSGSYSPRHVDFSDPLRWIDVDKGFPVVREPVMPEEARTACEYCNTVTECCLCGPVNGDRHYLCRPCAERRLRHERDRFNRPRSIGRPEGY